MFLFYPDGTRLLLGDGEHSLVVYDLASEQIIKRADVPSGHVRPVSFSASGLLVTTGISSLNDDLDALHLWDGGTLEWKSSRSVNRPSLLLQFQR